MLYDTVYAEVSGLRILVVADTHQKWRRLEKVVLAQPQTEVVIHLGDCCADAEMVRYDFPAKMFCIVSGNCDFSSDFPDELLHTFEGKRIFAAHGHQYGVKSGLETLERAARSKDADICLFGHTHSRYVGYRDGLYIMNPGSLGNARDSKSSYGIIDITAAGIVTTVVDEK